MADASPSGVNLRALAKEREARQAAAAPSAGDGASSAPVRAAPVRTAGQGSGSRARAAAPQGSISRAALLRAHRSIRLARSLGLVLVVLGALVALLFGGRLSAVLLAVAGVQLARGGGAWLHSVLPPMLQEGGGPPSAADVASASGCGLFSAEALAGPADCLTLEYEAAVENLAFACTYGKRNCLTNQMYSGELSLGKVLGLVWGKLSQGVVRCY